jgi:hypothetical protein
MPDTDSDAVRAIAAEIEQYIGLHPGAADTVEGIQRWWLSRQLADESTAMLAAALTWLTDRGVVARTTLPDGRTLFAAPRRRDG